jgi:ABC-type transport system involved in cytochrome c biogenesis ATPase subunit
VADNGVYGGGLSFTGITLIGPPPLGRVHVPLSAGVQSVYGLNGAGKTRLLRAVQAALSGTRLDAGYAMVHATVADDGEAESLQWLRAVQVEHLMDARETAAEILADWLAYSEGQPERARWEAKFGTPELPRLLRGDDGRLQRLIEGQPWPNDLHPWGLPDEDEADASAPSVEAYMHALVEHHELVQYAYHELSGRLEAHRSVVDALVETKQLVFVPIGTASASAWLCYLAGTASQGPLATAFQDELAYWTAHSAAMEDAATAGESVVQLIVEADRKRQHSSNYPFNEVMGSVSHPVRLPASRGPQPWPDWASVPALEIARTVELPMVVTDLTGADIDVDSRTNEELLNRYGRSESRDKAGILYAVLDEDVEYRDTVTIWLTDIADRATQLARHVLPQLPPHMLFELGHPENWLGGDRPRWVLQPYPTTGAVPLAELSDAERRWAAAGIALALRAQKPDNASIILCDEPEAGLHRRAEARLPIALARLAADTASAVLAATHAPSMLDARHVQPIHLARNADGHAEAAVMTLRVRQHIPELLDRLGISAADLLQWARVLVLLEGEHDRAVIDGLLADALDDAQALVLSLGGAKHLAAVAEAEVLFDYTDAPFLVVLDNLHRDAIITAWSSATAHATKGHQKAAIAALRPLEALPGGEAKWLRQLGQRAIDTGRLDRLHIDSIGVPDIICTLPVAEFTAATPATSWDDLLARWQRSARPGHPATDLKGWLAAQQGRPVSLRAVRRAVEKAIAHPLHPALEALASRIRDLSLT